MWSFAKTGLFQNAKIRNRILFVNRLLSLLVSILKIKKETLLERLFLLAEINPVDYLMPSFFFMSLGRASL
jgi:hypothetical protein